MNGPTRISSRTSCGSCWLVAFLTLTEHTTVSFSRFIALPLAIQGKSPYEGNLNVSTQNRLDSHGSQYSRSIGTGVQRSSKRVGRRTSFMTSATSLVETHWCSLGMTTLTSYTAYADGRARRTGQIERDPADAPWHLGPSSLWGDLALFPRIISASRTNNSRFCTPQRADKRLYTASAQRCLWHLVGGTWVEGQAYAAEDV